IGHFLVRNVPQNTMPETSIDSFLTTHFLKLFLSEKRDCKRTLANSKIRGGKLMDFDAVNHPINSKSLLLAHSKATRQSRKRFISRLNAVSKAIRWNYRRTRIRNLKTII